jgi:hypothetical protein
MIILTLASQREYPVLDCLGEGLGMCEVMGVGGLGRERGSLSGLPRRPPSRMFILPIL